MVNIWNGYIRNAVLLLFQDLHEGHYIWNKESQHREVYVANPFQTFFHSYISFDRFLGENKTFNEKYIIWLKAVWKERILLLLSLVPGGKIHKWILFFFPPFLLMGLDCWGDIHSKQSFDFSSHWEEPFQPSHLRCVKSNASEPCSWVPCQLYPWKMDPRERKPITGVLVLL